MELLFSLDVCTKVLFCKYSTTICKISQRDCCNDGIRKPLLARLPTVEYPIQVGVPGIHIFLQLFDPLYIV